MTCDVVTDLVPEHRGQLGLGTQVRQQPAMNVDVAPTDGEGVDRVIIEHEELEIPVRDRRVARHARADHLHVVLQRLVLVQAVEFLDLLVVAPCALLLALHRGEDDVVRAALRIGGAVCGGERGGAGKDGGECAAHGRGSPPAGGHRRASYREPPAVAYFLRNLSTRPAGSTIFCLPVLKGWQFEDPLACRSWPRVEVVLKG